MHVALLLGLATAQLSIPTPVEVRPEDRVRQSNLQTWEQRTRQRFSLDRMECTVALRPDSTSECTFSVSGVSFRATKVGWKPQGWLHIEPAFDVREHGRPLFVRDGDTFTVTLLSAKVPLLETFRCEPIASEAPLEMACGAHDDWDRRDAYGSSLQRAQMEVTRNGVKIDMNAIRRAALSFIEADFDVAN